RIAAARVQEARAQFVVSRSDLYPSLDYGAGVSRANLTAGVAGGPGAQAATTSNFYYGTLTMSWELDIWGRIRRSNEAARAILPGRSPMPIPRGRPMYAQAVVPTVPAGLPSALLERRPDLRQAEQQLVGANARIGVAKAEFFPKLNLTALFGTASPEVSALTG